MEISGPITTVHDKHICCELIAVARIGLSTSRRLSDRSRSAGVVLGNNPIRLRRMSGRARTQSFCRASLGPFMQATEAECRMEARITLKEWKAKQGMENLKRILKKSQLGMLLVGLNRN